VKLAEDCDRQLFCRSPGHIDKQKLLEIARKNAMTLLKQGVLPSSVVTQDKMVAIKAGGKSVAELTGNPEAHLELLPSSGPISPKIHLNIIVQVPLREVAG
jgi:hypothetical protein